MLPEATYDGIRSHMWELGGGHVQVWLSSKPLTAHHEMTVGQPERQPSAPLLSPGWEPCFEVQRSGRGRRNHARTPPGSAPFRPVPGPSLGI